MPHFDMDRSHLAPTQYLEKRMLAHQDALSRSPSTNRPSVRQKELSQDGSSMNGDLPSPPSSWRNREHGTGLVRSESIKSPGTNTPRSTGFREQEDAWAKLKNENINLKTNLDLAKQQVYDLRHKLKDAIKLQEENDELAALFRDAEAELRIRERAVDEAVVQITELELRNRQLEAELAALRRHRAPRSPAQPLPSAEQQYHEAPDYIGRTRDDGLSNDTPVRQQSTRLQYRPSFIDKPEPHNAALRQLFVENGQLIRPIPSNATLLDRAEDEDMDEDPHLALRSPAFSEMSDADQKEIHQENQSYFDRTHYDTQDETAVARQENSPRTRLAETGRWVDSSATPEVRKSRPRQPSSRKTSDYQSFEQALRKTSSQEASRQSQQRSRGSPSITRIRDDDDTQPTTASPGLGAHVQPSAPDTLSIQTPNTSARRSPTSHTQQIINNYSASISTRDASYARPSVLHSDPPLTARRVNKDFMPQMFDDYDEPSPVDSARRPTYTSDSSESPVTPRHLLHPTVSLAGSTMIDAESTREVPGSRGSHVPPIRYQPQYDGATDRRTQSSTSDQSAPSITYTNEARPSTAGAIDSGIPFIQRTQSTQSGEPVPPMSGPGPGPERRPSRAAALKERLNKFRRGRINGNAEQPAFVNGGLKRSDSITQKFGLRRYSSISQTTPITARFSNGSGQAMAPPNHASTTSSRTSPHRTESQHRQHQWPTSPSSASSQSIPNRLKEVSMDDATPRAGEFGELKSSFATAIHSYPTRLVEKNIRTTPLVETATIAFPSRGRDSSRSSKTRGVLRTLSRTRAHPSPPQLLSGRRA